MTQEKQDELSGLSAKIAATPDTHASATTALGWVTEQLDNLALTLSADHKQAVEQVQALATLFKNNSSTIARSIVSRPNQPTPAELAAQRATDDAEVQSAVAKVRNEQAERRAAALKKSEAAADKAEADEPKPTKTRAL